MSTKKIIKINKKNENLQKIVEEFLNSQNYYFGIFGAAGSGKTTIITKIYKNTDIKYLHVLAPTHKAKSIARKAFQKKLNSDEQQYRIYYDTIHKFFHWDGTDYNAYCAFPHIILKETTETITKQQTTETKTNFDVSINQKYWIVIDEISMLDKKFIICLHEFIANFKKKIEKIQNCLEIHHILHNDNKKIQQILENDEFCHNFISKKKKKMQRIMILFQIIKQKQMKKIKYGER